MIMSYLTTTKNYLANHKLEIVILAAAIPALVLMKSTMNQQDQFLKEHGLYEAFYQFDEE